jgi:hypothetical protein
MRTVWFINVNHAIAQCEHLHWTQGNASSATETTIFIHDEFVKWNSSHDRWKDSWFMGSSFSYGRISADFLVISEERCITPSFPLDETSSIPMVIEKSEGKTRIEKTRGICSRVVNQYWEFNA